MEPRKEPPITNQIITQSPEAILPDRPVSKKLDLTSIKGYTDKRKATKLKTMIEDCKTELAIALNIFDPHEISLNHSAVLFCCQIVEDIFCKPGQGAIKEEIVVDVCKQYFNNDGDLVKMVLELVFHKIIKTTLFRRNKERIKNVLSWLGGLFGIVEFQTNFSASLQL